MILGADGKKLSKRHGATSVEEYAARGYLPDTMVNFLALLGWSLDGETTIIPRDVLCKKFGLDRITKKDAVFDETKLDWMNGQYIKTMQAGEWVKLSTPWLAQARAAGMAAAEGAVVVDAAEAEPFALSGDEQAAAVAETAADIEARARRSTRRFYPLLAERARQA